MPHTSLNESLDSLVNQSLYSSVEIRGTKSLKDQDHMHVMNLCLSTDCLYVAAKLQQQRKGKNTVM